MNAEGQLLLYEEFLEVQAANYGKGICSGFLCNTEGCIAVASRFHMGGPD